jgi:F-type H+-transporting ATPase subunit delta
MTNAIISRRYAKAVFELALESKSVEKIEKDLLDIQDLLQESTNLRDAIQNPVTSRAVQHAVISEILKTIKVTDLTKRFVAVLIDNGRLNILNEVAEAYMTLLKEHKGEVTVNVTSATVLSKKQSTEMEKTLTTSLGKKVQVVYETNEGILGGIVIRIGSKMLDASVAGGLEKLAKISKEAIAS